MAVYSLGRLVSVGIPGQLQGDSGAAPDLARTIGSTGLGIAIRLNVLGGGGGGDFAQVWAQPTIVAADPLAGPVEPSYLPIGASGQLIIPGPVYCWTRSQLGIDSLTTGAAAAARIDLGIALWRRRGRLPLGVELFRLT